LIDLLADTAPTVQPSAWEWDLIQALVGALLTVVGVYLSSTVRGLREDLRELREEFKAVSASNANLRERVAVIEATQKRHTGRMAAAGNGRS
jgi:regulator of replication initiation timing